MTLTSARHLVFTGCFTDIPEPQPSAAHAQASHPHANADVQRGIGVYDSSTQPWRHLQTVVTRNPSWLACHPGGHVLYAVNEVDDHDDANTGALQIYQINTSRPDEPVLTHLATRALAPGAAGPTHVAIDPTGQFLVVSCYDGGQFNVFELDTHGMPGEVSHAHQPVGHGLDPDRQEAPHAHHAACSPKGDYWLTCDLGLDRLTLMRMEQAALVKTDAASVPPGAGARHAVFHPVEPWIYVITEMHATLMQLTYDRHLGTLTRPDEEPAESEQSDATEAPLDEPLFNGALFGGNLLSEPVGSSAVPLLPNGYTGEKSGAGIVMHPTGRWLYASTRRNDSDHALADSVSAWAIHEQTGRLSLIGRYSAGLSFPRAIALDPTGDTLYALNQKGDSIVAMKVCGRTGSLSTFTVVVSTPQPTCLVWPAGH